ncbi:hypothetical protein BXY66_3326 [Shimia isoporae]|uniref:Membrane-bound lysozyme inhibitor of c-type lysozyme MliC n=1 Tax=Shimia isoporae TaxID=647720 RepID=A0A4R1N2X7_9RHOB|nr:hypothetical protein [Shimia isoporae]TCL00679.1 hypothetical protein BXY66_3326 [Shimia isoporae]
MKSLPLALTALLISPFPALAGSLSENHPDALVCSMESTDGSGTTQAFLFLSGIRDDGSSLYLSLGSAALSILFDEEGNPAGPNANLCNGMSLPELTDAGMTRDF